MKWWRWGVAAVSVMAAVTAAILVPTAKSQAVDSSGAYLVGAPWSIVGMSSWEIFWHNSQSGQTKKWYMRHDGVFEQQDVDDENFHLTLIGPPWSIAGVGAFGMSGDKDLLWHDSSSNETQIWYLSSKADAQGVPTTYIVNRRFVTEESGQPMIIGLPWTIVAVGDLNNDGTADIVWHNSQTSATQVWFMDPAHDGSQIKLRVDVADESGQEIFVGAPWSIVGSSDIDGDGHADLVWHNSQTNETQIWFMNGNQIAHRATVVDEAGHPIFIGAPWSVAGSSDIDTDGTGDIVWHDSQTNETQIWFMNGNQIRERKDIVDIETPSPPPSPSPSPTPSPSPSLTQVHTYTVQNCDSHATSAGAAFGPSKSVWVNDITGGTGFREMAVLQGFPVGELCGVGGFSPQTFVFNATAGHTYELRVIDYAIPPNCTTDSPNGCRPLDVTFQGNAGGQNPVTAVTG